MCIHGTDQGNSSFLLDNSVPNFLVGKALCAERYRDWAAKFDPLGIKCASHIFPMHKELIGPLRLSRLRVDWGYRAIWERRVGWCEECVYYVSLFFPLYPSCCWLLCRITTVYNIFCFFLLADYLIKGEKWDSLTRNWYTNLPIHPWNRLLTFHAHFRRDHGQILSRIQLFLVDEVRHTPRNRLIEYLQLNIWPMQGPHPQWIPRQHARGSCLSHESPRFFCAVRPGLSHGP